MQRQTNSDGSCLHDFENIIYRAALQLPLSLLRNTLLMKVSFFISDLCIRWWILRPTFSHKVREASMTLHEAQIQIK